MCLQGFPHNHTRDSMCPMIKGEEEKRLTTRGAVQVLKNWDSSCSSRCVTTSSAVNASYRFTCKIISNM